jgi:hypothetical protein
MPHITTMFISNADAAKETALIAQQGLPDYHVPTLQPKTDSSGKPRQLAPVNMGHDAQPLAPTESPVEAWPTDGPVPVAAQKAAGVAPEDTVTIADQKAGAPLPELPEGSDLSSVGISSSTSAGKPDKSGSSAPEMGSSLPSPALTAGNLSSADQALSLAQLSTANSISGSTQETGPSQPGQSNSSAEQQTEPASGTEIIPPLSGRELIHAARAAYEAGDWNEARRLLLKANEVDPSMGDEVNMALQAVQTASESVPSAGGFLVQ